MKVEEQALTLQFQGNPQGVVIGDHNTVTLIYQGGQERVVPLLARARPAHAVVGREALLQTLKQRLIVPGLPSTDPLIVLHGLPGVGKTTVAELLAYDEAVLKHFQDGVLWADLGPAPDVLAQLSRWAMALALPPPPPGETVTAAALSDEIRSRLGAGRTLLILDDAWDAATALLFQLGGPGCACLVTTRKQDVAAELALDPVILHELDEAQSLALLEQLAPSAVQAEAQQARQIVSRVGGLPLALVLVGSYLRVQSRGGQSRRLQEALEKLARAEDRLRLQKPVAGGQISLEAVIGVSDQALEAPARAALRALAVFPPKPNTFSEDAALAVAATATGVLDALSDYGLLESAGDRRYTLHQIIVDYARAHHEDSAPAERRLAAFFAEYAAAHALDYARLDPEQANLLAAAQAARRQQDSALLVRLLGALAADDGLIETRGTTPELLDLMDAAIAAARQQESPPRQALYDLLGKRGTAHYDRGERDPALACYQQALEQAEALANPEYQVTALCAIAMIHADRQDAQAAGEVLQRAQTLIAGSSDLRLRARLLDQQGYNAYERQDYESALRAFSEEAGLAEQLGNPEAQFFALLNVGAAHLELGRLAEAQPCLRKALAIARRTQRPIWQAHALFALGASYLQLHQAERGRRRMLRALALYRQSELLEKVEEVQVYLREAGQPLAAQGEPERGE